ncbi:MAG TPA: crossover junction endodeoxyribonuclease RuvC [Candidatus Paceibacterota bacterium]
MRILGIDPGYDRLGLAVVEGDASAPSVIWSACALPPKGEREKRLAAVFDEVAAAIKKHGPDRLAIETLFFNANVTTGIGVAEARGAVLAAAGRAELPVMEYSPQQVKIAVTGHGAASKDAVARMVPRLAPLSPRKRLDDELDAIAVAICSLADRYPHPAAKRIAKK